MLLPILVWSNAVASWRYSILNYSVTRHAHAFHRVSECVRALFLKVNELISVTKKVFKKAPSRILTWKNTNPALPLPPDPILTRWGTWVSAALFYAENLESVKTVIVSFDPEESEAIRKCQTIIGDPNLKSGIAYTAANLHFLPRLIESLEKQGLSLTESFSAITAAETAIQSFPGSKGETIKKKSRTFISEQKIPTFIGCALSNQCSQAVTVRSPTVFLHNRLYCTNFLPSLASTSSARSQRIRQFCLTTAGDSLPKILPKYMY